MSLIVSYRIECDHGTCLAIFYGSSKEGVCAEARSRGWLIEDGDVPLHVCRSHAELYDSLPW